MPRIVGTRRRASEKKFKKAEHLCPLLADEVWLGFLFLQGPEDLDFMVEDLGGKLQCGWLSE